MEDVKTEGQTVFVHCRWGVSRSSSLVIGYLMREKQWTLEHARDYVKERRPWICPHATFVDELRAHQSEHWQHNKKLPCPD